MLVGRRPVACGHRAAAGPLYGAVRRPYGAFEERAREPARAAGNGVGG
ncbi:hypothetical protein SLNWT_4465 [Streptomyces albus]|uniref:Uncharacterized protein n=1 Tax=Streptomyces albus (strain ATCC 21838 / DSM 41398 / FERM P-419 / JCM 4703 / NBRC 107858) TaxID=1081613 RepID=A0A0B5F1X1_STRA4|nr:hypothetical protein SLNWT_4465 [Streptomyces albus]AOU79147.1 hypothetical protein SLNHY_4456 [Streptomyces albus]AYN34882.1 hypothetical protein DUI70_4383 [Streptomyces albus]